MGDVRGKYVMPSTDLTAFSCPHCGTLTSQTWFNLFLRGANGRPGVWTDAEAEQQIKRLENGKTFPPDEMVQLAASIRKLSAGALFTEKSDKYTDLALANLNISKCGECSEFAIWMHTRMLWPAHFEAPVPSPDMPPGVRKDYLEASSVFPHSPKSAAALLRLAIERLCKELGEKGKDINKNIGSLVRKGLDPQIQKALDIVRVIGNNAVHPGQMSEDDVHATAEKLFSLVNIICEYMITRPLHIEELFAGLPQGALEGIAKRDADPSATKGET